MKIVIRKSDGAVTHTFPDSYRVEIRDGILRARNIRAFGYSSDDYDILTVSSTDGMAQDDDVFPLAEYFSDQSRKSQRTRPDELIKALEVIGKATIKPSLDNMSDEDKRSAAILFPDWSGDDMDLSAGDVVNYNGEPVEVVQAHTSQPDWTPDAAPALFKRYIGPGQVVQWVQPTGAQDAYQQGQQVTHNGQTWQSDVDANTWEPPTQWTQI